MYAIVDIETTGGYAQSNGITEIAIYIHDGKKVTNSFCSLIDPGRQIPSYISSFTGITNDMVERAPSFDNVAHKIFELLENNIFVAHNVNFDYSFVKNQLSIAGYQLNVKKLCTVRYSRKVFPGLKSYSLGNICAYRGIEISGRHRAGGDAEATVKLLEQLFENDADQSVLKSFLKKGSKEYILPPNLPKEQFEKLPPTPGVYYFHDEQGKMIYIGKAIHIQKRVGQHFGGNATGKQKQDFMRNIHAVTYTECATELMALILESIEIKKHWPEYNRAHKHVDYSFALYSYEDRNGYQRMAVDRIRKHLKPVITFRTMGEALEQLKQTALDFDLCPKLCQIDQSKNTCDLTSCKGACEQKESPNHYNERVLAAIEQLTEFESYAIIGDGLNEDEFSCVLIEKGLFYGMGYIPEETPVKEINELKEYIQPMKENFFIRELIDSDHVSQWGKKVLLSN